MKKKVLKVLSGTNGDEIGSMLTTDLNSSSGGLSGFELNMIGVGADGAISGMGSVAADLQAELFAHLQRLAASFHVREPAHDRRDGGIAPTSSWLRCDYRRGRAVPAGRGSRSRSPTRRWRKGFDGRRVISVFLSTLTVGLSALVRLPALSDTDAVALRT